MMEGKTEYGYRWHVNDIGMRKHKSVILTDDEYARNVELERKDLEDMLKALDDAKQQDDIQQYFEDMTKCEICESKLAWDYLTETWYCPNPKCRHGMNNADIVKRNAE